MEEGGEVRNRTEGMRNRGVNIYWWCKKKNIQSSDR